MPVMLAVTPLRSGPVTVTRTRSVRVVGDMAFCGTECSRTRHGRVTMSGVIRLMMALILVLGAGGGCTRRKPIGPAADEGCPVGGGGGAPAGGGADPGLLI